MKKQTPHVPRPRFRPSGKRARLLLLFFSFCLLAWNSKASAQDSLVVSSLQKDAPTASWHPFKQIGSVSISYQYVDCGPTEFILFKVQNSTNSKVSVSWKYQYLNNGSELAANPDDTNVRFTINADSSLAGGCYSAGTEKLAVFVREGGHPLHATVVKLNDLQISVVQ